MSTATDEPATRWWHRADPAFVPLVGFFSGIVFLLALPGLVTSVLGAVLATDTVASLVPLVLVMVAVPAVLAAVPRTRRFGIHMALGMALSLVTIAVVGALVVWVLYAFTG